MAQDGRKYDDDDLDDMPSIKKGDGNRVSRADLRSIAIYQKVILVCILVNIITYAGQFLLPTDLRWLAIVVGLPTGLTGTVFVFLLSTKVHNVVAGILLGLLALIPCIGFIVLYYINGKATNALQANGIRVGLLGASLSDLR